MKTTFGGRVVCWVGSGGAAGVVMRAILARERTVVPRLEFRHCAAWRAVSWKVWWR
jgi:hypothetical protein